MIKKNLTKMAIIAAFGIAPSVGMQDSAPFLDDTTLRDSKILKLVESGNEVKALIQSTDVQGQSKAQLITTTLAPVGWQMNDNELYGQEKVLAQVVCLKSDTLSQEHIKLFHHPYTLLRTLEETKSLLTPGNKELAFKVEEYKRPDGTTYKKFCEALHVLQMEERRVPVEQISICEREWNIFSQWRNKTRHQVRHYSGTDVFQTTKKFLLNAEAETGTVSDVWVRKELKPSGFEAETPNCGAHGKALQPGWVVTG